MNDKYLFALFATVFLFAYLLPAEESWPESPITGGLAFLHEYAKFHMLTGLLPAFFIAGAIASLIKKELVLKYLGSKTSKPVSYGVAAVSGSVLAVCSCTILPLFAGIWKKGAGLGPAIAFLFSGPAINVAAIFLTASVLGFQIGLARGVAAIFLSIVIGLLMAFIFSKEDKARGELVSEAKSGLPLSTAVVFIALQVLFLVANGLALDFSMKLSLFAIILLSVAYIAWFRLPREYAKSWLDETWSLSKTMLPVLFAGVFIAGLVQAILPAELVSYYVGGNSFTANILASIFGALMYFCTLTEVPIVQMFVSKGMGSGPSLALLLAGPSLSLPSMLVLNRVLGAKKTIAYALFVILFSALAGVTFGWING